MLGVWVSAEGAKSMEKDNDEEVLEKITNLMRKFLDKTYPNMQDPRGIMASIKNNC